MISDLRFVMRNGVRVLQYSAYDSPVCATGAYWEDVEIVADEPAFEVGKCYKTRAGDKVIYLGERNGGNGIARSSPLIFWNFRLDLCYREDDYDIVGPWEGDDNE